MQSNRYMKALEMDIQALVDHQLDPRGEKRVRALLATSPGADARYKALLKQKSLLHAWYWKGLTFH